MADPMKERAKRAGQLHSDLAIPPGEYLKESLEAQVISLQELATRSGIPPKSLAAIIEGTEPITASAADGLAEPTGVPANIWLGLEAEYWPALADAATDERQGV
jgi:HTH-type transcriptional regulator / antitoxin HigA